MGRLCGMIMGPAGKLLELAVPPGKQLVLMLRGMERALGGDSDGGVPVVLAGR